MQRLVQITDKVQEKFERDEPFFRIRVRGSQLSLKLLDFIGRASLAQDHSRLAFLREAMIVQSKHHSGWDCRARCP
jgi:hypothetical protein